MAIEIGDYCVRDITQFTRLLESVLATAGATEASGGQIHSNFINAADLEARVRRGFSLCLVAKEGERVMGVLLLERDGQNGHVIHVLIGHDHANADVARGLVDRAAARLRNLHIHKCRFCLPRSGENRAFWDGVKWGGVFSRSTPLNEVETTASRM